ncbi:LPP20 family lipoprotein [Shewanella sp. 10N.261.52.F9]|uniref:LPP20 family lipoprotein n=1 Tax=Shewanella sp. 10N.261.52.F9 TaxID=3229684 RepID=UPI003552BA04
MKSIYKIPLYSLVILFTIGCKSTPTPNWYLSPQNNNPEYIIAVGEGRSLDQAKKSALSNINSALWTEVNSSFSMSDSHRSINNKSHTNAYVNNAVNTKTANIALSGVEYTNIAEGELSFYAQAKIKKSNIVNQISSDLNQINQKSITQFEKLNHQDPIQWWLANKDNSHFTDLIPARLAILNSLSPSLNIDLSAVDRLTTQCSIIKSNFLIYIKSSSKDEKMAQMLAEKLSVEGIKTTTLNGSKITHKLILKSDLRQSIMTDAYITTKITTLELKNRNNDVIGSSEVISTGNSLTSYKISNEGAERHFSSLIDERGVWSSLGLK